MKSRDVVAINCLYFGGWASFEYLNHKMDVEAEAEAEADVVEAT